MISKVRLFGEEIKKSGPFSTLPVNKWKISNVFMSGL
jgi:hypothetical protein